MFCWYSLEKLHQDASNEYPQHITSVAQLDVCPTGQKVAGSTPRQVSNIFSVEIDHEIFSRVILPTAELSNSGERMCTKMVNCLED